MANRNQIMQRAVLYLHLYFLLSNSAAQNQPYQPTDAIFLNTGSPSKAQSLDGQNWDSDANSKFCPPNSNISSPSNASAQHPSVPQVPYLTARIIRSQFTCIFPVTTGPKFIRLYFYPATYSAHNESDSFFTVTANGYTLLSNFSAYLTASASNPPVEFFNREFIVTVSDSEQLSLTFTPSPNSFAFINGIEVVSMPTNLYFKNIDHPYTSVGLDTLFYFDNTTSLETVFRLNVGGEYVAKVNDTGMYRPWSDDTRYISGSALGTVRQLPDDVKIKYTEATPAFVAPEVVYSTQRTMGNNPNLNEKYNLTWLFPVDSGFNYLVRLHFCETEDKLTEVYDRKFYIFINNMTAEEEARVIRWSGGKDNPVYRDYIVWVPAGSNGKQDLWLALHPNTLINIGPRYTDAILNGVEIFKLNNSDGSLAGSNPEIIVSPPEQHPRPHERKKRKAALLIVLIVGAAVGSALVISLIALFFIYRRKEKAKDGAASAAKKSFWPAFPRTSGSTTTDTASLLPTDLCHRFTMAEIRAATTNFHRKNVIGIGGFGTVYKGFIENGSNPVAIKRLSSSSKQGIREFHTEIKMLSRLRHAHLVSLIGYCDDQSEMILVYEFMPCGNLQDHLYKTQKTPLPWKQRLQICIGAAQGLHYLHTGAKHSIIHRDVKSSNILLDQNWIAKVSDFGLSKADHTSESQTHVSSVVKGTLGYLDPEYLSKFQLTEKSDVYSFGVVLLEVVCGRPPVMATEPKGQVNLVDWARICVRKGTLDQIIDPHLKGDITRVSLKKFMEIAESCVCEKASERPTVSDVVYSLELALELQQSAQKNGNEGFDLSETQKSSYEQSKGVTTTDDDASSTSSDILRLVSLNTVSTNEMSCSNNDSDKVKLEDVFSQIKNQHGR